MATAKRRRTAPDLTPAEWAFLNDEEWPTDTTEVEAYTLEFDTMRDPGKRVAELWERHRDVVLGHWTHERPGTRPSLWWQFDAPRWADPWTDCFFHGSFAVPRRRVGGTGIPLHEARNIVPRYRKGVPADHVDVNPNDPPRYEDERVYLERFGLLTDAEVTP